MTMTLAEMRDLRMAMEDDPDDGTVFTDVALALRSLVEQSICIPYMGNGRRFTHEELREVRDLFVFFSANVLVDLDDFIQNPY